MTTINTSGDLLRLLREDTNFYEQARRLILTDELIALPERFAAFTERVDGHITKQEHFNERVDKFITKQEHFNERVDARFEQVDARFDRMDARFDRMEDAISDFKNRFSESQVKEQAATIAMKMGYKLVRTLSNSDLSQMCQNADTRDLSQDDLTSFTLADLVLEVADQEENRQFISVEVSYTADQRDTYRVRRNADYLTRFTGKPAHAAIASVRNDHDTQNLIDAGTVWWYPLED